MTEDLRDLLAPKWELDLKDLELMATKEVELIWKLDQLLAQECQEQVNYQRLQSIRRLQFREDNLMPSQWPHHKLKRLKFTLKSMKMTNGLLSKNSIHSYIMKNKSSLFLEIKNAKDLSEKNLKNNWMRRKAESREKLRKVKCMRNSKNNILNCWRREKSKSTKKWKERLCKRKIAEISNCMRKNSERR